MYQGETLSLARLEGDFLEINFNNKNGSVNKFDSQTLDELRAAMSLLAQAESVRGLLLTSSKSVFVVGADITEFSVMFNATREEFVAQAADVNRIFSDIEDLPYPSVAAINGFALGGGLEICLTCDKRVISSKASVGLPETGLGIMPGWGGTVRLPRLAGFNLALHWIVSGAPQNALKALEAGAVDLISEPENLRDSALAMLADLANGSEDFLALRKAKLGPVAISLDEAAASAEDACRAVRSRQGDNYPAAFKVAELMVSACHMNRDAAVSQENHAFFELTQTPQARALTGLFLGEQYVVKQAKVRNAPFTEISQPISKAAVIGAGIMGGGIAYQNALKGLAIVMKDIKQPALDLGSSEASKLLNRGVKRGKLTEAKAEAILSQIQPSLEDESITDCDMVVEAVVEIESVKSQVLASVEAQLSNHGSVITSNTSTISINRLADSLQRPENFCGMHFFNPVHAMPLVEIIRGEKSSEQTIAAVCAYALKLGKKPIVVNDCPGFLVNRVLFAALLGMEMLIAEGADFEQIDQVMEKWGLPMGPAYLSDVIGLDTIVHCYSVLLEGLPERFIEIEPSRSSQVLFDGARLGQKNGLGYYRYSNNEQGRPSKTADTTVIETFENLYGKAKQFDEQEIVSRIMGAMGMEMVRCLEEGVVASPTEADMALIYGIGFPAFRGGICRWMDEVGLSEVCEMGDKYGRVSPLYEPTEALREKADKGETLY
jgi:3-hydroxyacyl-CoA dehydrogenase/enoyl-CoA hydratase/3-hydroxybutyryl-CoA epimerase/enoyl-CoA isomerase